MENKGKIITFICGNNTAQAPMIPKIEPEAPTIGPISRKPISARMV